MSNQEFGKGGDDRSTQDEGKNFGQNQSDGQTKPTDGSQGIDLEQYEALRKRDENAQSHIQTLESENRELRDKYVELEKQLASATTLDEALARIANQGEGQQQQAVDQADVAQVVREVLGQHQTEQKQESNWNTVQSQLKTTFGDWQTADQKVLERCSELDLTPDEATRMAKNNPKAFMQLFVPQSQANTAAKAGSSTGTGNMGQRGAQTTTGEVRDKAWWNQKRRENPTWYWSVDAQAQMRRDLFSE